MRSKGSRRQGQVSKRGDLPPGTPLSKFRKRQLEVAIPAMQAHDARAPFMRCLVSFYGEKSVAGGPMVNAEDLPARLGRAAEFWEEWERWKRIANAKAESSERKERQSAARAGLLSAFR